MKPTPHEEITPQLLRRVHLDNVRDNQIGGNTDGITPEVAQDIGYSTAEEVESISSQLEHGSDSSEQTVAEPLETTPKNIGRLTIAEKNANERAAIARHRRLVPRQRRGR